MSTSMQIEVTRGDAGALELTDDLGADEAVRQTIEFLEGGLNGCQDVTTFKVRDTLAGSTGTITLASCPAGTVVCINGVDFIAVSTTAVVANNEFDISGGTDTLDATALKNAINNCTDARIDGVVTAESTLGVVTLTTVDKGRATKAITIETKGILATAEITCLAVQSGDTITVNGVTLTSRQEMARNTIALSAVEAGEYVEINGHRFTATAGVDTAYTFSINGNNTQDAAALKTAINLHPDLTGVVTASSSSGTVTVRAVESGTGGNSITLVKSGAGITLGGAVLADGQATSATTWDYGDSDDQSAAEIARCVNAATDSLISGHVTATSNSSAGTVTLMAVAPGLAGNTNTIATSSGSTLGITGSAARLAGGTVASVEGVQASGTVTISSGSGTITAIINGVSVAITWASSDDNSAALLAAAINSSTNALVRGHVYASAATNIVTVTAIRGGVAGNQITFTATGTGATASGSGRLASGAVPTTVVRSGARLAGGSDDGQISYTL